MLRAIPAALAGIAFAAASALAADDGMVRLTPLHVIPVEILAAEPIAGDEPVRVRLASPDPPALAKTLGVALAADAVSVVYDLGEYPQLASATSRTWLEATFMIDFTEKEFEPLREELEARAIQRRPDIVRFVADFIEEGSGRDWDLASVVARSRKGDCTEHAVLTSALARLRGIPARVAVGVVLVSTGRKHEAFGHAWAEFLEDGKWQVGDAALLDLDATVRYLPLGVIEDEGLGYAMNLMDLMRIWIDRVHILGPSGTDSRS
jgi:hypothetical protein